MPQINQIPSDRMAPEQRRREIAAQMANGLVRLRSRSVAQSANLAAEKAFDLVFSGRQRVHTDPVNNAESR
ncbi:hypothetical protein [Thiomonas sp.]